MSHVQQLRIDWPACQARGLCAELLPEAVALDDWGYPIVTGDITPDLVRHARAAVKACPHLALKLQTRPDQPTARVRADRLR